MKRVLKLGDGFAGISQTQAAASALSAINEFVSARLVPPSGKY
jgi:hypothetical protein